MCEEALLRTRPTTGCALSRTVPLTCACICLRTAHNPRTGRPNTTQKHGPCICAALSTLQEVLKAAPKNATKGAAATPAAAAPAPAPTAKSAAAQAVAAFVPLAAAAAAFLLL